MVCKATFATDLTEFDAMVADLQPLVDKVWRHCESTGNRGRTVVLIIKFADFEIMSRSRSFPDTIDDLNSLDRAASDLLRKSMPLPKAVKLLGDSLAIIHDRRVGIPQLHLAI